MLYKHVKCKTAPFQKEMIHIAQDQSIKLAAITAFRGSAKSTVFSLALPLWAVVGKPQNKYVVIVCQTQARAQQVLGNLRMELETNDRLIEDIGPFIEGSNTWNNCALELPRFEAKISVFSVNEMIRGIKYGSFRPQLFIYDDLEDVQSAKTLEARDALWQRINGEIIPAGDSDTRNVFIGNLVHEDSVMMRLKTAILTNQRHGIYREFPLVTEDEIILWPAKYPSLEAIEELKNMIGSELDYLREYLLKIVPSTDQVILREWIQTYTPRDLPPDSEFRYTLVSIDPAISLAKSACHTGIVIFRVYGKKEKLKVFVDPYIVNEKLNLEGAIRVCKEIQARFRQKTIKFIVEKVGMQIGYAEALEREGIPVTLVSIDGQDKHARLVNCSVLIKKHTWFALPITGNMKHLVNQTVDFDASKYLDLVDALTLGLKAIDMEDKKPVPKVWSLFEEDPCDKHWKRIASKSRQFLLGN